MRTRPYTQTTFHQSRLQGNMWGFGRVNKLCFKGIYPWKFSQIYSCILRWKNFHDFDRKDAHNFWGNTHKYW